MKKILLITFLFLLFIKISFANESYLILKENQIILIENKIKKINEKSLNKLVFSINNILKTKKNLSSQKINILIDLKKILTNNLIKTKDVSNKIETKTDTNKIEKIIKIEDLKEKGCFFLEETVTDNSENLEFVKNGEKYILDLDIYNNYNENNLNNYYNHKDINKGIIFKKNNELKIAYNYKIEKKPILEEILELIKKNGKGFFNINIENGMNEIKIDGKTYKYEKSGNELVLNENNLYYILKNNNINNYYLFYNGSYYFISLDLKKVNVAKSYDLQTLRNIMLENINKLRLENGVGLLKLNDSLNNSAQKHSEDMNKNNYYSHVSLNGDDLRTRIFQESNSNSFSSWGENIAKGQIQIEEVMLAWFNSPGHKKNMLNPDYTEIGIGFDNYYWVQNFGSIGNVFLYNTNTGTSINNTNTGSLIDNTNTGSLIDNTTISYLEKIENLKKKASLYIEGRTTCGFLYEYKDNGETKIIDIRQGRATIKEDTIDYYLSLDLTNQVFIKNTDNGEYYLSAKGFNIITGQTLFP